MKTLLLFTCMKSLVTQMLHILRGKPARFPFLLLFIDLFVGTSSLDLIGGDRKLGKERERTCSERPRAGN